MPSCAMSLALRSIAWSTVVWIAFVALEAGLPLRSAYAGRSEVLALVACYMAVLSLMALVVAGTLGWSESPAREEKAFQPRNDGTRWVPTISLIRWTLIISMIGLLLIFYDKAFVQGIDYSRGPSVARSLWKQQAATRQGVSSIFSVIGNIASVGFFISLVLVHLHWERLRDARPSRWLYLIGAVFLLFVYSYLSGGRTPVLAAAVAAFSVGLIRQEYEMPFLPGGMRFGLAITLFGAAAAVAFALYIFAQRAGMNDIPLGQYAENWIEELGGERTAAYFEIEAALSGPGQQMYHLGMTMGAYLVHSLWIFDAMTELASRTGQTVFVAWIDHVNKLPFFDIPQRPYHYVGYFPTLPGALYYQFGTIGMGVGAALHGGSLGVASVIVKRRQGGVMAVGFVALVLTTTFLAPLGVAFDFMVVPMLFLLSFVMIGWFAATGRRMNVLDPSERR